MSRCAVRHERAVLVLAIAILPWAAVSRGGGWRTAPSPSVADTSVSIEALTSMLVVVADRPSLSFHVKRTDGVRLVETTPAGKLGLLPPSTLTSGSRPVSSTVRAVPLARHLAGRGPPLFDVA